LIDWKCNLKCSYCCNEQDRFRKQFRDVCLDDINWQQYDFFCISGGEPLMFLEKLRAVINKIPQGKFIILYSNGTLMTPEIMEKLNEMGIHAMNVGLHYPSSFNGIIKKVESAREQTNSKISIRYHAQDIHETSLVNQHPNLSFKYWTMDDCDRENEDRVVWTK
jgi:MoaA/NifB/PqqE/SkfB family radical SAM enzyme